MMKFKKIFILFLVSLTILTFATVSATDENITHDLTISDEIDETIASDFSITQDIVSADENNEDQISNADDSHDEIAKPQDDLTSDEVLESQENESKYETPDKNIQSESEITCKSQIDDGKLKAAINSNDDVLGLNPDEFTIELPAKFVIGSSYMRVNLPTDPEGVVTIYDNSKLLKKISSKDFVNYEGEIPYVCTDLTGLKAGHHTIKVVYSEGSHKLTKKASINVGYRLSVKIKGPYLYGQSMNQKGSKIRIALPANIKNKPVVKIDGKKYKGAMKFKKDKNFNEVHYCYFDLDISKVSVGTHTLKVSYKEGKKYPSKTITKKFKVKYGIFANFKLDSYNSGDGINDFAYLKYGEGNSFSLKLPSNAKGKLSLYTSKKKGDHGKLYKSAKLKKGYAKISLDSIDINTRYIHAEYTGKDYKIKSITRMVSMRENIICPETMGYHQNKYLIVKSYKNDNRQLDVYYDNLTDNIFYGKIKMVNGVGKLSLKDLPISTYMSLDFYEKNDWIGYSNIDMVPLTCKNIKMYYNDGNKYSVKVYNYNGKVAGKGKEVTFLFNGQKYKVKTNAKGIASLKITAKPGSYKITTYYKGHEVYQEYKLSNKVVVKHALNLDSVKVKKSAKKLVLKATLKQGKKVLKGKKVTFKFNGEKYAKKTNGKGVVKITVKKSAFKNLKVGKKITYSATYQKDTVKRTVKVLK